MSRLVIACSTAVLSLLLIAGTGFAETNFRTNAISGRVAAVFNETYSPTGSLTWDRLLVVEMDSTGSHGLPWKITQIIYTVSYEYPLPDGRKIPVAFSRTKSFNSPRNTWTYEESRMEFPAIPPEQAKILCSYMPKDVQKTINGTILYGASDGSGVPARGTSHITAALTCQSPIVTSTPASTPSRPVPVASGSTPTSGGVPGTPVPPVRGTPSTSAPTPAGTQAGTVKVVPMGPLALRDTLRIDPKLAERLKRPPMVSQQLDDIWRNIQRLSGSLNTDYPAYASALRTYDADLNTCQNKSYNRAEMNNAGCADSDTVGTCQEKLLNTCMQQAMSTLGQAKERLRTDLKGLVGEGQKMYDLLGN